MFLKFVSIILSTKPRGGGLKALVYCPLKKRTFLFICGFPYDVTTIQGYYPGNGDFRPQRPETTDRRDREADQGTEPGITFSS